MKRSDMLKLMIDIQFNPPSHIVNMHDGGQQSIRLMEYLLNKMEHAGMLPPPSSFTIHNVDKELGFVAEVTYDFPINEDNSVNLWDKE